MDNFCNMDKLLEHSGFRLIHVDVDGMSLEGPFNYEIPLSPKELLKREKSRKFKKWVTVVSLIYGAMPLDGKIIL
jgi:hypothetical protein